MYYLVNSTLSTICCHKQEQIKETQLMLTDVHSVYLPLLEHFNYLVNSTLSTICCHKQEQIKETQLMLTDVHSVYLPLLEHFN